MSSFNERGQGDGPHNLQPPTVDGMPRPAQTAQPRVHEQAQNGLGLLLLAVEISGEKSQLHYH